MPAMTKSPSLRERIFGMALRHRLPERVQQAIDAQQRESELLIAAVQVVVVVIFALLYQVSPFALAMGNYAIEDQNKAPYVIAAYFIFSIARLILCMRGFSPRWFLAASVIADISLLMLLIYYLHFQFIEVPGFYLKAPTLFYAYIFIALRTLRFEVFYVVLTGVAAIAGWVVLTWIAYTFERFDGEAVHAANYAEYITSSKVLLSPEAEKIIAIAVVTFILAVAIIRARRLLVRAVAEGEAARDLARFFAPEIAQAITASESRIQPGQGEIRDAAILHVDIRGFTPLSARLAPSELMVLLADYQARMVQGIRAHGGSVDKFLGDGILASFGAARPSAAYAADALRAAHALRQIADAWSAERRAAGLEPVRIGITMAAGPVVFGAVGDATRLEYTVIGDAVNLAAKLDKQCKVENCTALAPAEMLDLAERQGYEAPAHVEIRHRRHVDGVAEPLDLAVIEP